MNHTEVLTRYIAHFIDELAKNGVTDVVISPGSRSTPLAMTAVEHPDLQDWVIIDERSAAFFALGMAKQTKRPTALICTSGTAAANYYPALIEAYYSRVPLVVLTADRPHELRDVGAPQAIEQIDMYGKYPKWFHEMALPEATRASLDYARSKATRAVTVAGSSNAGPVHLNFPLREPLTPDFAIDNLWGNRNQDTFHPVYDGMKRLTEEMFHHLSTKISDKERGVILCGPQMDSSLAALVTALAESWQLPILADPLSQVRSGDHSKQNIIESYDAFLRHEDIRDYFKPDFIIRFGAMPVSKALLFYVKENSQADQFIIEETKGYRDPTGIASEFIYADPVQFCEDALAFLPKLSSVESTWLKSWQQANQTAKTYLNQKNDGPVTEGEAVRALCEVTPEESYLYVGNSMAVRDIDTFLLSTEKNIHLLANRGVNGIDGMVSSGLGAAANAQVPVTLVIGDLSFFHDLNGLLAAKHYQLNVTVLLINNDGGGIFSFLPQSEDGKHFEKLFGTPLGIELEPAIKMYGGCYQLADTEEDVKNMLEHAYRDEGLTVIEVKTDRTENAKWHRALWNEIQQDILRAQEG